MLEGFPRYLLMACVLPILFADAFCDYSARDSCAAGSNQRHAGAVEIGAPLFGSPSSSHGYITNAPPDTAHLYLYACPGEEAVAFGGNTLAMGAVQLFRFPDQSGEDSLVEVIVQEAPPIDFWVTAEPSCPNGASGQIDFWSRVGPTAPYEFSIDGGLTFSDEYTYTGLPGGIYELWARDVAGCTYEYGIEVPELPALQVETSNQAITCADSVKLVFTVANPQPYTWQWRLPNEGGHSGDPALWAKMPGAYLLTVSNYCDTVQCSIDVVFENAPNAEIYIPNSFSPNNDGVNDCFRSYTSPSFQLLEYELRIFSRWGAQVFETHDPEGCWDGAFKGKEVDADSALFAWFITARAADCKGAAYDIFREGWVKVMK